MALLSGINISHDIRLKRGDLTGTTDHLLDALARALHFDPNETSRIFELARSAPAPALSRTPRTTRPNLQGIIDAITAASAVIRDNHFTFVPSISLRAVYSTRRG